jgi:replication-associated recombination protein RarA
MTNSQITSKLGMDAEISRVDRCINAMVQNPSKFQHCIFVGPPGCGKTTAAWNIVHQFYKTPLERVGRALFLNASDERSLDAIRSKVYPFTESAGSGLFGYTNNPKIIIFDEVETLTEPAQLALRPLLEKPTSEVLVFFLCNSLCKIHASLRSRFFILRFDPLPEPVLKSRLKGIAPATSTPGRFDVRLRRSDLRYFLLNSEESQKATIWLCKILNAHPSERKSIWKKSYHEISLQMFGCYMLTFSLLTNTGYAKWKTWIDMCDPNLSLWMNEESAIETMEKMWSDFGLI